ncbi:Mo-dependent nitrogenase C-terminal domain-containing protein [Crocosphaera sp. XPORK-15E]|uniref:Mo-dependent nitrogenase C-terminal domain-containing protein n=1 Tax=Crocosphaera sp. XPORK-15E TaxID=3110247 RepID=UPI002B20E64E|nr:Mo-dependent nitrogenase C-terminal domain-containing protein [Crocosphaera sp. XPORK-15E]MEA5536248.1 Mo-dependent nitrogenase C-terminal domain-containing protein [Crocosphaera sp. XPORK-15E]
MSVTDYTIQNFILSSGTNTQFPYSFSAAKWLKWPFSQSIQRIRAWLAEQEISDRAFAHRLCRLIPSQCPFEREIKFFGYVLVSIPPLCKLNPLYDDLMMLRFRALCYLADEWNEDISPYC